MIVACVWVRGNVPFTAEYVVRLRSMVRRHLQQPHRFVCLTDQPGLLPDNMDAIPIEGVHDGAPGWWAKLELFNRANALTGEGLYLDLDVLIVDSLDPIAEYPSGASGLTLIPHAGNFEGRYGRKVVKLYNSSVMRLRFEEHPELWEELRDADIARLWGDQDWIGERLPALPTMPREWFPRLSEIERPPRCPPESRVILCKRPKNHIAVERWPWFAESWR